MITAARSSLLNVAGMRNLVYAVLGIAVAALAVSIAVRSHAGRFAKVVEMVVVVLIAALVAGLASGSNFLTISRELFRAIFG